MEPNELVLDIEADELLVKVNKAWIIGWLNRQTGKKHRWRDGDLGWMTELDKATLVIGHNVTGYDLPLLFKLFGYILPAHVKVRDTQIMSLTLMYNKFPSGIHKLAEWGEYLGFPKGDFHDFSKWSPEMETYWERDLDLTSKVYDHVVIKFREVYAKTKNIVVYLNAENAVNRWFSMAELYGWPFDVKAATALLEKMEAELQVVRDRLLPKLGSKTVATDKKLGVVEPRKPKFLKSGAYDAHTSAYFEIDEWSAHDDRLVDGPYSRVKFVPLSVDSISDMKIFLFRHGWVPTEYNMKDNPEGRGKIKTSPKITEDSLECMEGDGKLYCDFLTTSSRVGILKGWLRNCDEKGRLHGTGFAIGTPSMRARHNIIVNVPAADSVWGKEMRSLFISEPGFTLVGCDSAGNQARGLAHYLKSPEYVDLLLHGDIHTFNANALNDVVASMKINWDDYLIKGGVKADVFDPNKPDKKLHTLEENLAKAKRGRAKRVLYAFLFGASGGKLWSYLFDKIDDIKGKKLKLGFTKAVPGFKDLLDKLDRIYGRSKQSGDGYIPGIAGNDIYCNSFHKLLVYLLQACEKATCSAALMLAVERMEAEGIPFQPCIMYHDEIDFMVPDAYAERAAEIGKQAFIDGPKLFNIQIMDGESKTGKSWYEIH